MLVGKLTNGAVIVIKIPEDHEEDVVFVTYGEMHPEDLRADPRRRHAGFAQYLIRHKGTPGFHFKVWLKSSESTSSLILEQELVDNNNLQEGSKVRILAAREDQDKIAVAGDSSGLKKESNVCYIQLQMKSKIANGDSSHDEELTSLSWLQNNDLLQSIFTPKYFFMILKIKKPISLSGKGMNLASSSAETNKAKTTEGEEKNPPKTDTQLGQVEKEESENESCGQDGSDPSNDLETSPSSMKLVASGGAENSKRALAKPPHSFSMLIFLAIESSSAKALPVRDIYSWITQHFPYYRLAGNSGWKNSVRHNLSLNRCFCKFERGLVREDTLPQTVESVNSFISFLIFQNVGKGSLWMVDPVHRPQLMQSLCKVRNLKSEILQQLLDDTSKDSKASATVQVSKYTQFFYYNSKEKRLSYQSFMAIRFTILFDHDYFDF